MLYCRRCKKLLTEKNCLYKKFQSNKYYIDQYCRECKAFIMREKYHIKYPNANYYMNSKYSKNYYGGKNE